MASTTKARAKAKAPDSSFNDAEIVEISRQKYGLSTQLREQVIALREAGDIEGSWAAANVTCDFPWRAASSTAVTTDAHPALVDDLTHLAIERVIDRFVPLPGKRSDMDMTLLLAAYPSVVVQARGRELWLTAKQSKAGMTLGLASLVTENQPHRWDTQRWRWDDREPDGWTAERAGIAGRESLVRSSVELTDAGKFDEAFALFDIELAASISAAAAGDITLLMFGGWDDPAAIASANPANALRITKLTPSWSQAVREMLRRIAPWNLHAAMASEIARRTRASGKKPSKPLRLRVTWMPHESGMMKQSIFLVARDRDGTHLAIEPEATGSLARLAEVLWQRPHEIDAARFDLAPCAAWPRESG